MASGELNENAGKFFDVWFVESGARGRAESITVYGRPLCCEALDSIAKLTRNSRMSVLNLVCTKFSIDLHTKFSTCSNVCTKFSSEFSTHRTWYSAGTLVQLLCVESDLCIHMEYWSTQLVHTKFSTDMAVEFSTAFSIQRHFLYCVKAAWLIVFVCDHRPR